MDDLFQGYMVLDALGDFLYDDTLISRNKQSAMAPQLEQHVHRFNCVSLMAPSDPEQHGQQYASY